MSTTHDIAMSSSEDDGAPEGEPLLIADTDISSEPLLRDGRQETGIQRAKPLSRLVFYFMAIHFLLAFAEIILVAPLIRLFENSLCLSHYGFPIGGVEEALCKIKEVQRPLATIRGWKSTFDTIPVLLVAIPVGRLGDHHGRRQIMAMALLGVVGSLVEIFVVCAFPKTFPLRLVWLSSAILLFGGGLNSASAFMWAMVTESIPSEGRSHAFYYIFSAFYVAELISSSIASVTLDISPWIPCGLAMGSIMACLALLALMPDPRAHSPNSRHEAPAYPSESLLGQSSVKDLLSALSNRNIQLTIPVFLVGIFRYAMLNILIQYASVRFGLRISTGATFYTETAVVNIFLFSFLVPQLTAHIRHRFNVQPHVIDLFLVRTSVTLMCIGCLAIGLAQTSALLPFGVLVFAAGFGSRVSALALVSSWVSDDSKATMFAGIVILESLGHAVGDPAIQQIFAASLLLPPFWMAMPFFVGAGLYGIARVSSSFIRLERSAGGESGELVSSAEIGDA